MIGTILSASEGHYIIVAVFEQFSISKFVQVTSTAPSYQTFLFLRQMVKISYIIGQIKKIFWTKFISNFQFYIINCCKRPLVVCKKYSFLSCHHPSIIYLMLDKVQFLTLYCFDRIIVLTVNIKFVSLKLWISLQKLMPTN